MQDGNTYIAQQGFTTGEISPEVLARSELDKYQYALKQARNVYIRPYGAVYRRSGTIYHSACKYADKKAILVEFNYSVELSYLLEIGEGYIRVHKNGEYLGVELTTPYTEADLPKLFQSTQPKRAATDNDGLLPLRQNNFNPRSPRGLRHTTTRPIKARRRFQSTQPKRAATKHK